MTRNSLKSFILTIDPLQIRNRVWLGIKQRLLHHFSKIQTESDMKLAAGGKM